MIKKIIITLQVIIVLLVLGVIVFISTFDLNHYRQLVIDKASKALGRPVQIQSLSAKLSLVPTIKAEGVRILDNNQQEPLLDVPQLEAVIELPPLLHRQIIVQKITIPQANLIWRHPEATLKEKAPAQAPQPTKNNTTEIWIDAINVSTLQATVGDKPYEFKINRLALKGISKFSFDITYLKNKISVNGNFGSILELLTKKEMLPVDLALTQDRNTVKINGKIEDLKKLEKMNFQINAKIPNLAVFLKTWNIQNPMIPNLALNVQTSFVGDLNKAELGKTSVTFDKSDFTLTTQGTLTNLKTKPTAKLTAALSMGESSKLWNLKPFNLDTKVLFTPQMLVLSDIVMDVGKSDLKGNVQINLTENIPFIHSRLNSVYFDIHDLIAIQKKNPTQQTAAAASPKKIFGTDSLPFNLLRKVKADIQFNIGHFKFSDEFPDYADIACSSVIKENQLQATALIKIMGGKINSQLNANAIQKTVTLAAQARDIRLEKIKSLEKSIRGSLASADINVTARGDTMHQLASSMNGKILGEISAGEIISKEFNSLPATLNIIKGKNNSLSFSTQDQKTKLLCGAINVPVNNGIISSDNQIALETDTLNFVVNGQINLKEENLHLTMIPSVSETRGMANELLTLSQSVQLTGPWTAIKTGVDPLKATQTLAQVIGQKLSGEKVQNPKVEPTALCQAVLGHSVTQKKTTNTTVPAQQKKVTSSENTTTQKPVDLRQKLVQSLSQALTNSTVNQ